MSVKIRFPEQPMADGTIPALWISELLDREDRQQTLTHCGETGRWLDVINSPLSLAKELRMTLHWEGSGPTPEQTQKILGAMANLMVAVSEVGYEMAAAAHSGGEG